jgi:hypothetical protein
MVAVERVGQAKDGKYYTMRAKEMDMVDRGIDDMFRLCTSAGDCFTIGIGDGGK